MLPRRFSKRSATPLRAAFSRAFSTLHGSMSTPMARGRAGLERGEGEHARAGADVEDAPAGRHARREQAEREPRRLVVARPEGHLGVDAQHGERGEVGRQVGPRRRDDERPDARRLDGRLPRGVPVLVRRASSRRPRGRPPRRARRRAPDGRRCRPGRRRRRRRACPRRPRSRPRRGARRASRGGRGGRRRRGGACRARAAGAGGGQGTADPAAGPSAFRASRAIRRFCTRGAGPHASPSCPVSRSLLDALDAEAPLVRIVRAGPSKSPKAWRSSVT